jgi:hypothetical protein
MNRYETTLTLRQLLQRNMSARSSRITYVQGGDEFDCMEVEVDG